MKHHIKEEKGAVIVAFEGDVDMKTSPDARKVLLEVVARAQPVLVDLSGVHYIDSSGVASLVESYQVARKAGQPFILVSLSDGAHRVLGLARMDKVFTICATLEDGLAKIA